MTVYIVDIEAVDTRYTKQWKTHLPEQLQLETNQEVRVISGGETPQATTPGAFLNFGGTNVYKSKQLEIIGEMFCKGEIKDGDYFLYTDAWNPTVIQLRYMAELLGICVRIGGLWHAGSYDPHDFLGRLIGDKPWVRHAEHSMFSCYDDNFYATDFHVNLFAEGILDWNNEDWTGTPYDANSTIKRVGWPMEYLADELCISEYDEQEKRNLILFPHRIAPEKQVEIFRDLAQSMPEYEFMVCQEWELSKHEYHKLLGQAKVVFSANLQETLGISWYEGALLDAIPMVPDRLSYSEMAVDAFKYPSEWTESYDAYMLNKDKIITKLRDYIENYHDYENEIHAQTQALATDYFSGKALYGAITNEQR